MTSIPPTGPGHDDEAFERLRAADPAAGSEPDLVALRSAVTARAQADAVAGDQLATRRARWPIAAAAAAALVLGSGGGYAVGALQGGSGADDSAVMADTRDGAEADLGGGLAEESAGAVGPQVATDGAAADEAGLDQAWWGYGRTEFTAQGLSDQGGSAQVLAVDAASVFDAATLASAAEVLGVAGEPQQDGGVWTVGPQDGSGPSLSMYPDGSAALNFYDPAADPWFCERVEEDSAAGADGAEGDVVEPMPACDEQDLGPAPEGPVAEQLMRDLLTELGLDPAGFEMENDGGGVWTYVTAYEVLDGERTGRAWNATFTGAGLHSLYGSLAPLVALGDYPVVSPTEAVARLSDPRFGTPGPMWLDDGILEDTMSEDSLSDGSATALPAPDRPGTATVPDTPEPGSALSWPVAQVTITEAELVTQTQTDGSGALLLVPTYRLTATDGTVWSVLAVADEALDFSS